MIVYIIGWIFAPFLVSLPEFMGGFGGKIIYNQKITSLAIGDEINVIHLKTVVWEFS